ncbi:MAG TPA: hypothetical protein VNO55_06760 [Polyangia bacterium]|nr:hypothetical protein [Polyangia bacterium]
MKIKKWFERVLLLAGALAVLFSVLLLGARPWFRSWGASGTELVEGLPGDDIVPAAATEETRAITINAPAQRVWPWLAQLGQDRAGFYSFGVLEDLVGCEMPNLQHLDPALQHWRLGDKLWMYPPRKLNGAGSATLLAWEPGHAMAFATRQIGKPVDAPADGSWSFVVAPLGPEQSRLVIRGRVADGQGPLTAAFTLLVFEPMHFAMERKTMVSIKTLAEGGRLSGTADVVAVILWTVTFLAFVFTGGLVLVGGETVRWVVTFLGAGLLFQVLTLAQPPLWFGVPLVVILLTGLAWRRA